MKHIIIDIDDAYAEVLTISAVGRSPGQLNVSTTSLDIHDLKKKQALRVHINSVGKFTTERVLKDAYVVKTCDTCLYEDGYIDVPPCSECTRAHDKPPSRWEPKEEGEG